MHVQDDVNKDLVIMVLTVYDFVKMPSWDLLSERWSSTMLFLQTSQKAKKEMVVRRRQE